MIVDGKQYTATDLFALWLNGVAFHQDAVKRAEFEKLESLGAFAMLGVQVTALKLAGRIMDLDDIVADVLGEERLPRILPS